MGEPVRIQSVAEDLIRLHGLVPGEDIRIHHSGIRPGEKLYEELLMDSDTQTPSPHAKIFVEQAAGRADDLERLVELLLDAADRRDGDEIRSVLADLVPGARLHGAPAVVEKPPQE